MVCVVMSDNFLLVPPIFSAKISSKAPNLQFFSLELDLERS